MDQLNDTTKKRRWKQLCEKERYKIEALLQSGIAPTVIAQQLGHDRRTIQREIKRGTVEQRDSLWRKREVYCADTGQRKSEEKAANKGRSLKIGRDHKLVKYIEQKIKNEKYSPDAVIGEIKAKKLLFSSSICTKTLYNYIDSGLFLNISNQDLPVKRYGKKRNYKPVRTVALNNQTAQSIDERPEAANDRLEYGHWEMDCVVGLGKTCLLVLTERFSRQELIFKMKAKTQACVIAVLDRLERKLKNKFRIIFKTITMDNGCEFLDTKGIGMSCLKPGQMRTVCYYAHPYSAWERGSNEVANKLVRRFVPKGSNIDKLTNADVKRIEYWINHYPRRIFNYKSANDRIA